MSQGRQAIEIGPVGTEVAHNIAALRSRANMTLRALSAAMATAGRPIPVLGIRRMELKQRRVDVDDLTALAEVFEVSIKSLLQGPTCSLCFDIPPAGFTCNACAAGY